MKIKMICLLLLICIIITGCNKGTQSVAEQTPPDNSLEIPRQELAELNLRQPSDCMTFLETILSEIEIERKWKPNIILDYSGVYTLNYTKSEGENFLVFTVENGANMNIYIIVNEETREYRYFDVPKSFEIFNFDDSMAKFSCPSGQVGLEYPNFPYYTTYSFDEKKWSKANLPINTDHAYHKLGGNPYSFGVLDRIEVTNDKAEIIFNFEEIMKDESMGVCLPILHYWFDPIANEATLSFSGVSFSYNVFAAQLELLAGITDVKLTQTEVIDLEAKASGILRAMQITFNVLPEYNLYGEYDDTAWDADPTENNDISFWLWTEKK